MTGDSGRKEERTSLVLRTIAVLTICCLASGFAPRPAEGRGLGLSFDVFSVGPLSIALDISLRGGPLSALGGILFAGEAIASFFDYGGASASYPDGTHQVQARFRISISPRDNIPGDVLEIKYSDVFQDRRIDLQSGYLDLQEDGRMVFQESSFEGYIYLQYDKTLTVWDEEDNPILVITPNEGRTLFLCEKSERAAEVVELLFGASS